MTCTSSVGVSTSPKLVCKLLTGWDPLRLAGLVLRVPVELNHPEGAELDFPD